MTRAEFATRLAAIAAHAAKWCLDTHTSGESMADPERREPIERFIREVRGRLDRLEDRMKEEAGAAAGAIPVEAALDE